MKRPFAVIGLTIFFVTAFLFEFETGVTVTVFAVFTVALVVSILFRAIRKHRFLPTFFASGAVACALLLGTINFLYLPVLAYDGRTNCDVKAELVSLPEYRYGNCYYEARAVSVNGEKTDFRVRLVFSTPPEAEPYDFVEGKFNLFALGTSDEDALKSYKAKGIWLGGYPINDVYNVINIKEDEKPLAKKIIDLRVLIKEGLYRILPDERGDLAVALTIGDKSGLPDEIYSDFNATGITHVICVSGFHLSLWSSIILKILRKTGVNRKLSSVFAGVSVVFFMLVAGLTYSVVRAGVMMLVFLLSDIIMRRRDSLNSLGFAMAVTALYDPFAMGSVSLKLSALATLGIILYNEYISPEIRRFIDKINNNTLRKTVKTFVSSLMVTVSATAFTLPVSLSLYGNYNFLGLLANLIIVPVAGLSMVVSSLGAVCGTFLPTGYNIFAYVSKILLKFIIDSADFLERYDFLDFRINGEKMMIIFCGIFVFCIITVFISQLKKPVYALASLLCCVMFTVPMVLFSVSESKETKITVFECENSISVLVSYNGENMLLGCAGKDFFDSVQTVDAISKTGDGLDTVVVPYLKDNSDLNFMNIISSYKPERVYADILPDDAVLLLENSEKHAFAQLSSTENIVAESVKIGDVACVSVTTDDVSALVCFDPAFRYENLPESFK
ncbi:MAG: ComEC/Rec2 family competence protein, partial [Acutalibacteraceae bacterium]|nr:ComEC/Rec2 family competence protein [Acutalibacteraceae bacterium]